MAPMARGTPVAAAMAELVSVVSVAESSASEVALSADSVLLIVLESEEEDDSVVVVPEVAVVVAIVASVLLTVSKVEDATKDGSSLVMLSRSEE